MRNELPQMIGYIAPTMSDAAPELRYETKEYAIASFSVGTKNKMLDRATRNGVLYDEVTRLPLGPRALRPLNHAAHFDHRKDGERPEYLPPYNDPRSGAIVSLETHLAMHLLPKASIPGPLENGLGALGNLESALMIARTIGTNLTEIPKIKPKALERARRSIERFGSHNLPNYVLESEPDSVNEDLNDWFTRLASQSVIR